ncbi:MAG: ATP-binding cassette domain-containing protein, partial [Lachnospiraceae bacterium]|nr:ATP-binding cassette domain-containing protein [Lachnospiraceae bacterium]
MLELKGVCYSAEDENREAEILKDINVTIEDRFIAVTGPNGSGKSTLARIIAGIIKPTAGQILLDGVDITDLSVTE